MLDDRELVERRIDRILLERLLPACYGATAPLSVQVWHAPGEPPEVADALNASYRPSAIGEAWGPAWGTSWFHLTGSVPAEWAGATVQAVVDLGFAIDRPGFSAEALVHRPDGSALKGLNPLNLWIPIAESASGGEAVDLYVEAAANPDIVGVGTPMGDVLTAGDAPIYQVRRVELAVFQREVWELVNDVQVAWQLMHELSVGDPRRWNLLRALERALDGELNLPDIPGTAAAARAALAPALAAPAVASAHRVSAVGHAHIDSAWLWPLRETVRKVARTASNVTALMDDHPEFVFAMSLGAAVGLDEGAPPAGLAADGREGRGRSVRAGRRHVGGVGHQHARRRGAGPPARARQAVLPRRAGRRDRGGVAARLVRLHAPPCPSWWCCRPRAGS